MTPLLPVLVFEGRCGFCTRSARWAQRRLAIEHVEPWQRLDLDEYGLTAEQCQRAAQYVDRDGQVHSAEFAAIAVLGDAGGLWAVAGRLLGLPGVRQLAGVIYRLVARYRDKLPGVTPACDE